MSSVSVSTLTPQVEPGGIRPDVEPGGIRPDVEPGGIRPPGQKSTWYQWRANARLPMDTPKDGDAWEAYLSGVTGGQYRKRKEATDANPL